MKRGVGSRTLMLYNVVRPASTDLCQLVNRMAAVQMGCFILTSRRAVKTVDGHSDQVKRNYIRTNRICMGRNNKRTTTNSSPAAYENPQDPRQIGTSSQPFKQTAHMAAATAGPAYIPAATARGGGLDTSASPNLPSPSLLSASAAAAMSS